VREEDHAFEKHEAALKEAEGLIRSRPADLEDLSRTLAKDLLGYENRFNVQVNKQVVAPFLPPSADHKEPLFCPVEIADLSTLCSLSAGSVVTRPLCPPLPSVGNRS
jgi:hypothetical protein